MHLNKFFKVLLLSNERNLFVSTSKLKILLRNNFESWRSLQGSRTKSSFHFGKYFFPSYFNKILFLFFLDYETLEKSFFSDKKERDIFYKRKVNKEICSSI